MNLRKLIIPIVVLFGALSVEAMDVATNVWYNTDWCEDLPWVDLIRSARQWTYTPVTDPGVPANPWPWANQGAPSGMMVPADSDGYPLAIPYSYNGTQYRPVTIMLVQYSIQYYPYGTFTLMFEGKGQIVLGWDAHDTITSTAGGLTTHQFTINSISSTFRYDANTCRGLVLAIMKSDSTDHIRNIHVILPGYADKWQTQPVTPLWVQTYRPFKVIRYMVWSSVNDTKIVQWKDRITPTTFNQDGALPTNQAGFGGIADEHICDAANAVQRDAWVCVPSRADSDYIWHMAKLYHDNLDTNLRLWVEWGNETWNGMYEGCNACHDSAGSYGLSGTWWAYHGVAAARVFRIFSRVFSDNPSRLVKIISGQHASSGVLSAIINVMQNPQYNPTGIMPDAIATAPYFGFQSFDTQDSHIHDSMAVAIGVKYVMYEGGINGLGTGVGANFSPMYTDYNEAFAAFSPYFSMFNQFTCVGPPTSGGQWGAKQFISQPTDSAAKYKACYDYIVANGQWDPNEDFQPYTKVLPSTPQLLSTFNTLGSKLSLAANKSVLQVSVNGMQGRFTLRILNVNGRQVAQRKGFGNASYKISTDNLSSGVYVARLAYGDKNESKSVFVP